MALVTFVRNSHLGALFTLFISYFGKNLKVFRSFYCNVLAIIFNSSAFISTFEDLNQVLARFHKILLFLNLTQKCSIWQNVSNQS